MKHITTSLLLFAGLTLAARANDTMATADTLYPTDFQTNYAINPAGDNDYLRVTLPSTGDFVVTSEGTTDTYGHLLNSAGSQLAANDDSNGSLNFRIAQRLSAGTYYVRIRHYSARGTGNFNVRSTFTPIVTDDHGNTTSNATSVALSGTSTTTRAGVLERAGDVDMFRVVVSGNGFLNARTTGSTDTLGIIYNGAGQQLAQNDDANGTTNFALRQAVSAGTYFVRVGHYSSTGTGAYVLNVNFEGAVAQPPTNPPPPTNAGSMRALVIGISNYQYINDLNLCDDDARAVSTALTSSGWSVTTLIDSQASKANIRSQISRLAPGGGKFMLFYSGHGSSSGTTGYLCNWDCTSSGASMISETELNSWLSVAGATSVGVIMDSCFSGAFIGRNAVAAGNKSRYFRMADGAPADARAGEFMARNISSSNRVVIAGCRGTQLCWELSTLGHGWLTYNLLVAWRTPSLDLNRNRWISLEESFARVAAGTVVSGQRQDPQLYDGNGAAQLDTTRY
jgi:hypothetical protein